MATPIPASFGLAEARPAKPVAHRPRGPMARCALCAAAGLMLLFAGCWLAAMAETAGHGHLYRAMFMAGAAGPFGGLALGVAGAGLIGLAVGAVASVCRSPAG